MACKFTCFLSFTDALKENDVGIFQSDNGDSYRVKYKSNVCRDLLLSIDWTIPKQIFFAVKLYNTTFKRCISSKGMIVNGKKAFMKLRGAFNVSNPRNYKVLCVINMIPYITFKDCNELSSESFNDSGFIESEFNELLMDENNLCEETEYKIEDTEESSCDPNKTDVKVEEVIEPNDRVYFKPEIKDKDYKEPQSDESDIQLDKVTISDDTMMLESVSTEPENVPFNHVIPETTKLLMGKEISTLCYQKNRIGNDDTYEPFTSEEVLPFKKNSETEKPNLENSFAENREDNLINNFVKPNVECVSSNDTSMETTITVKVSKIVILDDYSEEIENINDINIHKDTSSGNNSAMDVDLLQSSFKNRSVSNEEDNILNNSSSKASKEISSNNALTKNQLGKTEFNESPGTNDRNDLHDEVKTVINYEDMNVMAAKNNKPDEKDSSVLSDRNISTYIQRPDTIEIYKDVNTSTSVSNSSEINIQKSSESATGTKKNNTKMDSHKSKTPKLMSLKTSLVFQTLVSKLSIADNELELTDINPKTASSSKLNIKTSLDSKVDESKIFPVMESELKGLSVDMLELLTSGDMADATITNGEKSIKVHRVIVSARSSTMKNLFTESEQDDIRYQAVVDIPSYIFEDVVIFLYVGLIHIKSEEMALDLYQAAEKYSINDLIDICSKHTSNKL